MTDLHILMAMMGGGFSITFILMRIMWNSLREDIQSGDNSLREEIKALRTNVESIDRRLCRLEGAFSSKEGCLLRYDHDKNGKVD